jgi:hypothetical protein
VGRPIAAVENLPPVVPWLIVETRANSVGNSAPMS